jgi:hypothetical protein
LRHASNSRLPILPTLLVVVETMEDRVRVGWRSVVDRFLDDKTRPRSFLKFALRGNVLALGLLRRQGSWNRKAKQDSAAKQCGALTSDRDLSRWLERHSSSSVERLLRSLV